MKYVKIVHTRPISEYNIVIRFVYRAIEVAEAIFLTTMSIVLISLCLVIVYMLLLAIF